MDIRRFLKKHTLSVSIDDSDVSKVPRLAGNSGLSTPVITEDIKTAGYDSGPEHIDAPEENPTQPSTSTVTSTLMSEETEVSQIYIRK